MAEDEEIHRPATQRCALPSMVEALPHEGKIDAPLHSLGLPLRGGGHYRGYHLGVITGPNYRRMAGGVRRRHGTTAGFGGRTSLASGTIAGCPIRFSASFTLGSSFFQISWRLSSRRWSSGANWSNTPVTCAGILASG